jgi:hypothetical protein
LNALVGRRGAFGETRPTFQAQVGRVAPRAPRALRGGSQTKAITREKPRLYRATYLADKNVGATPSPAGG